MKEQTSIQKKPSKRKYIIAAVIILFVLAGYIYKVVTWTPIDSESRKASEAIIRHAVAAQYIRDPNNGTLIPIPPVEIRYTSDPNWGTVIRRLPRRTKDPNNAIDPNTLTDEDFAQITDFNLGRIELTDIKLLEKFSNLQILYLTYDSFPEKDIPKWMIVFAKIGVFDLSERFCINLSPLEKLTNLQEISLNCTQVSDLEPLKKLTKLQILWLAETQVTDLKPLSGLSNLQTLFLAWTKVSNLEPLRDLKKLEDLSLWGTQVSDLEPITELSNLKSLVISETQVSNLEPIKGLINLQTLDISGTQIPNLEPLKEIKKLKSISIRHCPYITKSCTHFVINLFIP